MIISALLKRKQSGGEQRSKVKQIELRRLTPLLWRIISRAKRIDGPQPMRARDPPPAPGPSAQRRAHAGSRRAAVALKRASIALLLLLDVRPACAFFVFF
jgi:hypothetical protein